MATMASESAPISRARLYLIDPGALGDSDEEEPVLASCQISIERLFKNLPTPTSNDRYHDPEQDRQYNRALGIFLEEETGPSEHYYECRKLKSIATKVLKGKNPHGLRAAFIEGLIPILLDMSTYDETSAKSRYFAHSKWVLQGRKDEDAYECGEGFSTDLDDGDDEYRYLPKSLTTETICRYCQREGRLFLCRDCIQAIDFHLTIRTGYCSEICETLDKEDHKPECLARRRFARGAHLMKSLLMVIETRQTILSLESTCEEDDMIFLEEKPRYYEAMRGDPVVRQFYKEDEIEEEHARAALQDQYLPDLPFLVLSLLTNIEQYTILVKNAYRPIVRVNLDGEFESSMLRPHTVFCVTLHTGEKYAVDYAGGRFGWVECVTRWEQFTKHRVHRVIRTGFPAAWERNPATMVPAYLPEKKKAYIHIVCLRMTMFEVRNQLRRIFPQIPFDNGCNDSIDNEVWEEIVSQFKQITPEMFDDKFLVSYQAQLGFKSRMYLNANFDVWVEHHDNDVNHLKDVWFTKDQVRWVEANVVEDADTLHEIWSIWLRHRGVRFKDPVPSAIQIQRGGASVFE
ncbi:uncharacterized protein F4812DRAFT_469287 [Daldinia caldariorum]|uniref:uncharacterized protein n=1 Tax=Daldinia caldariorum TaxID=326644 RepID=UPI0020088230|nr:uncharacterized protein F4812DRAFT_469287 [Daldinia caldariorum]KAI1470767.1 hypothetical protein F4812DRAFT_469287 [Daldinia caldariorum]